MLWCALSLSFGVAIPKLESKTSRMRGYICSIFVSRYILHFVQILTLLRYFTDTREWTRIIAPGARPKGRYGHAVCMSGNTFYVSGGQVDGKFMNDLWGFDLSTRQLRESTKSVLVVHSCFPHAMITITLSHGRSHMASRAAGEQSSLAANGACPRNLSGQTLHVSYHLDHFFFVYFLIGRVIPPALVGPMVPFIIMTRGV